MSVRTRNIVLTLTDIDIPWAYRHYLNLPNSLTGANIKVHSPFSADREASFSLYKKGNYDYRWNCLSSGQKGDLLDLICILKAKDFALGKRLLTRAEAFQIVRHDFEDYLKGRTTEYIQTPQYENTPGRVTAHEMRKWETQDIDFWGKYGIGKKRLEYYNIAPLSKFTMHKIKDGVEHNMEFKNPLCYGYYTGQGELAKIYQPGLRAAKFIKVMEYIQGLHQLKYNVPTLLLLSSMKDGLSFLELDIPGYEFVSPDSENVLISEKDINHFVSKYENVRVLYDNDDPGKKAALKYKERYGFDTINLDLEKDVSDSIFIYGQFFVKLQLTQIL